LWAAASALSKLGFVTVAAPREQASSTGRSMPRTSDGKIERSVLRINEQDWPVYSVGGTPAQTVLHAVLEIMPVRPQLVVSGINYGENFGTSITVSGTVGAALESASMGIPSIAISLQLLSTDYLSYADLDFSASGYFTYLFAKMLLEKPMPKDIDLLKIEVPAAATPETPWRITRLARHRYYEPVGKRSGGWDEPFYMDGQPRIKRSDVEHDTDIYTVLYDKMVSVTPLSLDATSRVDLGELEKSLKQE
ncbi:MAG: 5'/3'-nucleotidase SurE, partial [Anaerolineaceae bacterium]|nr:5'/3'-nucleotidase SurE [Anaerolineaceae bacterium]